MGRMYAFCSSCNWYGPEPEVLKEIRTGNSVCPRCKIDSLQYKVVNDDDVLFQRQLNRDREDSIASIFQLHIRALCAHCECLGMNAENSLAVCRNETPPYNDEAYSKVLDRWGLVDEKGEPKI